MSQANTLTNRPESSNQDQIDLVCSWLEQSSFGWSDLQVQQGIEVLELLARLGIDQTGRICGFLQIGQPFDEAQKTALAEQFGDPVLSMLEGVERLARLSQFSAQDGPGYRKEISEENLRKMLITMVDDVRVVVIKLADQLVRMRALKDSEPALREQAGRITLDVYAPLANRLGIWQLKWELDDYALR